MHLTTLADPFQLQRVAMLCDTKRPFRDPMICSGSAGEWACVRIAGHLFALPVDDRLASLSFGRLTERLYWFLYHEVRVRRTAEIVLKRNVVREILWGTKSPKNWRANLRATLHSISKLRVGEWCAEDPDPPLKEALPLFASIQEFDRPVEFEFVIGEGFLGSMQQFALQNHDGVVEYEYPAGNKLRGLAKQQKIQNIYLPLFLGDPDALRSLALSPRQKRLFQAVIRELTFPPRQKGSKESQERSLESGERFKSDQICGFGGKGTIACGDFDDESQHFGFNGNGIRRGQGYKLSAWQNKAGYEVQESQQFLRDLFVLSNAFNLIVGAVGKSGGWRTLKRLLIMADDPQRRRQLEKLHVRVYSSAGCVEEWNRLCGWTDAQHRLAKLSDEESATGLQELDQLREVIAEEGLFQKDVAAEFGVSKQALSKALKLNRCSPAMQQKIEDFLSKRDAQAKSLHGSSQPNPTVAPPFVVRMPRITRGSSAMKKLAMQYFDIGWNVVPCEAETKKPYIRWKRYQTERIDREQICDWWTNWPEANIAVVLGPISDLLIVDVDGESPYCTLLEVCGDLPAAPTVKSGSRDPFRFHLYFKHPDKIKTTATKTPWNQPDDPHKLELRGMGGIIVAPPSLHKSGKRYAWVKDRSMRSIELAELPKPLLDGLCDSEKKQLGVVNSDEFALEQRIDSRELTIATSTGDFLSGKYSEANGTWNTKLFRAACDLNARAVPREVAEQLLKKGAKPKTFNDERIVEDTIASAYSKPRSPSKL